MSEKTNSVVNGLNLVILLGGAAAAFAYFIDIRDEIATKTFHTEDITYQVAAFENTLDVKLAPIQEATNAALSNTLPPRILNILKISCQSPESFQAGDLSQLLDRLLDQYESLNKRTYNVGECREGAYFNARGIRQD